MACNLNKIRPPNIKTPEPFSQEAKGCPEHTACHRWAPTAYRLPFGCIHGILEKREQEPERWDGKQVSRPLVLRLQCSLGEGLRGKSLMSELYTTNAESLDMAWVPHTLRFPGESKPEIKLNYPLS